MCLSNVVANGWLRGICLGHLLGLFSESTNNSWLLEPCHSKVLKQAGAAILEEGI